MQVTDNRALVFPREPWYDKYNFFKLYLLRQGGIRMPKVAYSEEDREQIREALVTTALDLMARQGIQHTTVEQVYRAVGISRTFSIPSSPQRRILLQRPSTYSSRKSWPLPGS